MQPLLVLTRARGLVFSVCQGGQRQEEDAQCCVSGVGECWGQGSLHLLKAGVCHLGLCVWGLALWLLSMRRRCKRSQQTAANCELGVEAEQMTLLLVWDMVGLE